MHQDVVGLDGFQAPAGRTGQDLLNRGQGPFQGKMPLAMYIQAAVSGGLSVED